MSDFSQIVKFFKKCYIADNRETLIWDIFSAKNEDLNFHNTNELTKAGNAYTINLPDTEVLQLQNKLEMYKREKCLLLAYMFIVGEVNIESNFSELNKKKICAPLILFNAEINNTNINSIVEIDLTSAELNTSVISQFINDDDKIAQLENLIADEDIENIGAKVQEWFNGQSGLQVSLVKSSASKKTIAAALKKEEISLFNGIARFIVNRSSTTRGIIHDLETLENKEEASGVLSHIFNLTNSTNYKISIGDPSNIPGVLSKAQGKVLNNAANKILSQVIGPPGTGKSYTIASIALDRFMHQESVLIVSQNEHAVDVVQRKLTDDMGISSNAIVRVGKGDYLKNIKTYFSDLLRGAVLHTNYKDYGKDLLQINNSLAQKETDFVKWANKSCKYGILKHASDSNGEKLPIFKRWGLKQYNKKMLTQPSLYERINNLHQTQKQKEQVLSKQINSIFEQSLKDVLKSSRKDLVNFVSAIKARNSGKQQDLFQKTNYRTILKTMPIWLCSLDTLYKALPLSKNLFSLVIIDEATQCDIASCLPALYRASRAVVVGDQKQLRHISFLSRTKQTAIQNELGLQKANVELNYRDMSILDLSDQALASQDDVVLLDEHYRSQPEIINFSNQKFYNGHLRIMTERPNKNTSNSITIKFCEGKRLNNINKAEADEIIGMLDKLIDLQKDLPLETKSNIGVLSFFREQAEYLQKRVLCRFDIDTIKNHQLRIGTPYAFQGEERDIMLISCCLDNDSPAGAVTYLNRQDVLNVSVTRAREYQLIFLSRNIDLFPPTNIFGEYLRSLNNKTEKTINNKIRDNFVKEISKHLIQNNINVTEAHPIAGIPLDILAYKDDKYLAIDLIGFPGEFEDPIHLERYKIFNRTGIQIFPLSLFEWTFKKEQSIKAILLQLQSIKDDGYNPEQISEKLFKEVKGLELALISCGEEESIETINEVSRLHSKLIEIINSKLYAESLTFNRYLISFENVVHGIIQNIKRIIALKNALPYNYTKISKDEDKGMYILLKDQLEKIRSLKESCYEGIMLLNKSAILWSNTTTRKERGSDFETAIKELEQLNEQIMRYSAKS